MSATREDLSWNRPLKDGSLWDQAEADQTAIQDRMTECRLPDGTSLQVFDPCSDAGRQPVVMLPMIADLNFVYAPQIQFLQSRYRILLYEPRLSTTKHVGILDRAEELRGLLDAKGIDAAHLMAWSDAGSAAYMFAKHYPHRCLSLTSFGLADKYALSVPMDIGLAFLARFPLESVIPDWLMARLLARFLSGRQVKYAWVVSRASTIPNLTRLFKFSIVANLLEHQPKVGEIHMPFLNVCGDSDALVTLAQARRMASIVSGGQFADVKGGEHFLNYVSYEEVNARVGSFLSKV